MAAAFLRRPAHILLLSLPLVALAIAFPIARALAVESSGSGTPDNENPGYHATETLDACMRKWDAGTHMSREAWRASCMRIQADRAPYVKK